MTTAGNVLLAIIGIATFIAVLIFFSKDGQPYWRSFESKFIHHVLDIILSLLCGVVASTVSVLFILCLSKPNEENYHTIYSNKLNANAKFVTDDDDKAEFVGGQPIKQTSETTTGALTLTKNGATVNRDIYTVRYLGDVEKDSVVEKIEYSKSTRETKLFGVSLIKLNDWSSLKIHLKKPASKIAQEKQNDQNRKELNSLLDKE